jgi:hypothetical protein
MDVTLLLSGRMLAMPEDGGICLSDVRTGKKLWKLPASAHGQYVALSPDSALLAVPGSLPPNQDI